MDILAQGAASAPGMTVEDGDQAWVEALLSELSRPDSNGVQSCVKLKLPTEQQNDEQIFLLRVRLPGTFGDAPYVCVYGIEAMAYSSGV